MSQQPPPVQTGSQMGQQSSVQQTGVQQQGMQEQAAQQQGTQYRGRLSTQQRGALTSVAQAIEVCEWCADQCVQEANPNMVECIRLCEDVAELGETTLALTSRNSRFGQDISQTFTQAVQACAQECARHQANHCQECAQVLSQTASAVQSLTQQPGQVQVQ